MFQRFIDGILHRKKFEAEMAEELRAHQDLRTADLARKGAPVETAYRQARIDFGSTESYKEDCRQASGFAMLDDLYNDVRYCWRNFFRSPGFFFATMLTLALGIGATTAIFSVVNAVVLRSLPYPAPDRVTRVGQVTKEDGSLGNTGYATFVDWRSRSQSFTAMAAYEGWQPALSWSGELNVLAGMEVTHDFFRVLGVRPARGHDFRPNDDRPKQDDVVIISDRMWRTLLAADPEAIGKQLILDRTKYTIIGVLPSWFRPVGFSDAAHEPEIWKPLGYGLSDPYACRSCQHLRAIARLKTDITVTQARSDLNRVAHELIREYPKDYAPDSTVSIVPFSEDVIGNVRNTLLALFALVGILLLVSVANVANLFVARAARRTKEIAVRLSLGAGPARLLRQMLTESLLISSLGGAVGIGLTYLSVPKIALYCGNVFPRLDELSVDGHVLLFAVVSTLVTSLVFGFLPLFQIFDLSLQQNLKSQSASVETRGHLHLRRTIIIAECALAFVLVTCAGLLVKSFERLMGVDPGFDASKLLFAYTYLPSSQDLNTAQKLSFSSELLRGLQAVPGVKTAAIGGTLPLNGFDRSSLCIEGLPGCNDPGGPSADKYVVSEQYFSAMGIPLLHGRTFSSADTLRGMPVTIVSVTLAERYWPEGNALGKRIQLTGDHHIWRTIVGIAGDVSQYGLASPATMQAYVPVTQQPRSWATLIIRYKNKPGSWQNPFATKCKV